MNNRIISGILGAIFLAIVLKFNQNFYATLNFIIAVINILAVSEIFTVMNITNIYSVYIPTLIFSTIIPVFGFGLIWEIFYYIYTLYIFSIIIFNKKLDLKTICLIYVLCLMVTLSLSQLIEIRNHYGRYGTFYILLALAIAWCSDTGAYFFGKFFGKHKLCPEISPKKTVEGAIGGLIVCIFSIFLITYLFNTFIFSKKMVNYIYLVVLGLVGSPISVLGDLTFSTVKRYFNVKDFGNFIPGHGGILDRFDSTIFVIPFTYLFIKFFPIIF